MEFHFYSGLVLVCTRTWNAALHTYQGGSNGCIPEGLSYLFSPRERGREKRVTWRISETSFTCVNIAVIEISVSRSRTDSSQTLCRGDFCQPSV